MTLRPLPLLQTVQQGIQDLLSEFQTHDVEGLATVLEAGLATVRQKNDAVEVVAEQMKTVNHVNPSSPARYTTRCLYGGMGTK